MRGERLREVRKLAQSHTVAEARVEPNPKCLTTKSNSLMYLVN